MDVLELRGITKSYGKVYALNNVNLEIPEGSVFGILGPNGSGKTTLLSIILDVIRADSGSYKWFGKSGSKKQRQLIGSLLETPNFYNYLSAINNLKVNQSISRRGGPQEIEKALRLVNLYDRRNSRFSTFSLGMKQRLAIGAALLNEPKVLVLDEPTNGLDPVGIAEIRELIREMNRKGHTIIMASHLLDEVEKTCTHVAILKSGNIITSGIVDNVLSNADTVELSSGNNNFLYELLQDFPDVKECKMEGKFLLLFFEKGRADPAAINRYCFINGITLSHISIRKEKLETRFFELTSN